MDLDFFGSCNQAQMEQLVSMMMQMEELPDFSETPHSVIDFSSSSGGYSSQSPPPQMVSASSTISYGGDPLDNHQYIAAAPAGYDSSGDPAVTDKHASMREMIFRIAAMQPIHIDPESVRPPKRRNVKISKDPQSVAARHRRERISERIRILQRLVPGGTKMDTASMLDEAIHYVKFLKTQVQSLERVAVSCNGPQGVVYSSSSSSSPPPYDWSSYQCFADMYQLQYPYTDV